jgi:hypothetical protein
MAAGFFLKFRAIKLAANQQRTLGHEKKSPLHGIVKKGKEVVDLDWR